MTDHLAAIRNLASKALRRVGAGHKPFVRIARQRARAREQQRFAGEARAVEREIAAAAARPGRILAGPWLAEVGYEALYWVPFLRWFQDAHRIPADRLVVLSRGGVSEWYRGIAAEYVDLFELLSPSELAARNEARMSAEEAGGRKQSASGSFDAELLARVRSRVGGDVSPLHPSLMFRLFRHVWHGNLPFDFFWTRSLFKVVEPGSQRLPGCPEDYVAVKFYTGTALPGTAENRALLRHLVARVAAQKPVVVLDTGVTFDEHEDYLFDGIPNVFSARQWITPMNNLGVQTTLIAHAGLFIGTCGGLAWLAPFLGTPTVAVYADDRQLAPHLFVARQAGRKVGAADFLPLDLRVCQRLQPALL